ncbi:MAG: glycosyltransferase family 39 protein [Candidatus Omnitrophica bacterium]|nr:glycosyltransferase family 39 protein [Candidatus Omnitrophota bacterium]
MEKNKFYKSVFLGIFLIFAALLISKISFFNEFGADDGCFTNIALNLLKGNLSLTFYGNFLENSKYYFNYPPLHSLFTAAVFKILGATYLTSKIVPVFFSLLLAIVVCVYVRRKMGPALGAIIAALIIFDPLLFSCTYNNRPDITAAFFFTLAALNFIEADKNNSLRLIFLSGVFSGLAMLSSYNCNWLFLAFSGYALFLIFSGGLKNNLKKIIIYLLSLFIIIGPWFWWIMTNQARRSIFFMQLIGSTSSIEGYSMSQLVRKFLNPLADLYLALFRQHSPYPIIAFLVFLYFLLNLRKFLYPFLLLLFSLVMMFFNLRAAHYFVIVLPICYICFGYIVKDSLNKAWLTPSFKKFIFLFLVLIIFFSLLKDISLTFKKSDLKLDSAYYSRIIKEYTEDGSRIATDPVFILSEYGNRKIINVGLLIWDFIRKNYKSYDEIALKVVDADYIILTEREKKWGELPVEQSLEFQNYLKERCVLLEIVDDKIHGPIWIYRSNHRNNPI